MSAKDVISLMVVAAVVAVLEVVGRMHKSELIDLASACVVGLTIATCISWHYRLHLQWTAWLVGVYRGTVARLSSWKFDWGLDLRRTPPLARRCPPLMVAMPALFGAIVGLTLAWNLFSPVAMRFVFSQVSYTAYVVGLTAVWLSLALVVLAMVVVPSWLFFDLLVSYTSWQRETAQRVTWFARASYFVVVLMLSVTLPTWIALLLLALGVIVAVALPWLPPTWHPDCLWRSPPDGPIYAVSLGTMFSLQLVLVALAPAVPILLALGGETVGRPELTVDSPLSTATGRVAIWLASCGLLLLLAMLGGHMFVSRWHDPSRPAPLTLHIAGVVDAETKKRWQRQLGERGWRLRFAPARPERTDVRVTIGEAPNGDIANSRTPQESSIVGTIDDFDKGDFLFRLERRDQVQRRRFLIHGLETIFRRAARRKGRAGCGFWVAPQYWFVDGLTRDETTDDETSLLEVIPPLYHRAIPRPARRHFFEMARALEIDLLFVEDGVNLRGLRSVLRVMFERYDIDGGREPLREVHFSGLPKMRVIIHDYTLDQPWTQSNYPEPDYRHLGRVRILHVFRDRGGDEDPIESPENPDWIFSPAGAM